MEKHHITTKKLIFICIATLFAACGDNQGEPIGPEEVPVPAAPEATEEKHEPEFVEPEVRRIKFSSEEKDIICDYNQFAWALLSQAWATERPENAIISPLSAGVALSMLANGAEGATLEEIVNVLGYADADLAVINSCNEKIVEELNTVDSTIDVTSANSLWSKASLMLKEQFVDCLANSYMAESFAIVPATYVDDVNSWCSLHTNGLIEKILPEEYDASNVLLSLINAIYFKGTWSLDYQFDKDATSKAKFHGTADADADFMKRSQYFSYCSTEAMQCLSIP